MKENHIKTKACTKYREDEAGMDSPAVRYRRKNWGGPKGSCHLFEASIYKLRDKNSLCYINEDTLGGIFSDYSVFGFDYRPEIYYNTQSDTPEFKKPIFI